MLIRSCDHPKNRTFKYNYSVLAFQWYFICEHLPYTINYSKNDKHFNGLSYHTIVLVDAVACTYLMGSSRLASMVIQWSRSGLPQLVCPKELGGGTICRRSAPHLPTPAGHLSSWLSKNRWSSSVATRNILATYSQRQIFIMKQCISSLLWEKGLIHYMGNGA